MKLLDWGKRAWFILFLQAAVILNTVHSSCSPDDDGRVAVNVMLRVGDIISNWIPTGTIVGGLWLLFDFWGSSNDIDRQIICYVEKYLNEYHSDRVDTVLRNLNHKFNERKDNRQQMEALRKEIEQKISNIQSRVENIQGSIYPLIPLWSVIHLGVYKQLIQLSPTWSRVSLKRKSDEWLLFYAKLMMRYARPHKHKMIASMSYSSAKDSQIHKSPANLLTPWLKLAQNPATKTTLTNMINSCRLSSGSIVQFKVIFKRKYQWRICMTYSVCDDLDYTYPWKNVVQENGFFSCSVSGSECSIRNCAKENILVMTNGDRPCRRNIFWMYSDNNKISHNNVVNILYGTNNNRGYWVSHAGQYSIRKEKSYDTKTCPGFSFSHIRSDCDKENLILREWETATDINIYDGSFIQFSKRDFFVLEVFKYNSECSKTGWLRPPFGSV